MQQVWSRGQCRKAGIREQCMRERFVARWLFVMPQRCLGGRGVAGANNRKRKFLNCFFSATFLCPLGCHTPFSSADAVLLHVESIHIQRRGMAPDDAWLQSMRRRLCRGCRRLMARAATHCSHCQTALMTDLTTRPPPVGTPLSNPEPPLSPSLRDILSTRRGVLEHVPRGSRTAVLNALGRVLAQFTCGRH